MVGPRPSGTRAGDGLGRLLAVLAVVAVSAVSGALAGGVVASRDGAGGPAAASAAPVPAELVTAAERTVPGVVSVLAGGGATGGSRSGPRPAPASPSTTSSTSSPTTTSWPRGAAGR